MKRRRKKNPDPKKWYGGKMPELCDLCQKKLCRNYTFWVDGKTLMGPWANMCGECFERWGTGLGTGKGQAYDCETGKKLEG